MSSTAPTLPTYLASGEFQSRVFENWESEFLQMGLFVLLTVPLRQRGSSESRKLDPAEEAQKTHPAKARPWAARQRGWQASVDARICCNTSSSTGFVRWWLNPDCAERRRCCSCPQPVRAMSTISRAHSFARICLARS